MSLHAKFEVLQTTICLWVVHAVSMCAQLSSHARDSKKNISC
jgi:hypothetical protein